MRAIRKSLVLFRRLLLAISSFVAAFFVLLTVWSTHHAEQLVLYCGGDQLGLQSFACAMTVGWTREYELRRDANGQAVLDGPEDFKLHSTGELSGDHEWRTSFSRSTGRYAVRDWGRSI